MHTNGTWLSCKVVLVAENWRTAGILIVDGTVIFVSQNSRSIGILMYYKCILTINGSITLVYQNARLFGINRLMAHSCRVQQFFYLKIGRQLGY